jgi:hypothetical protein
LCINDSPIIREIIALLNSIKTLADVPRYIAIEQTVKELEKYANNDI